MNMKYWILLAILCVMPVAGYAELEMVLNKDQFALANLAQYKRALALDLAKTLGNPLWAQYFEGKLSARTAAVDLVPCVKELATISRDSAAWCDAVVLLDKKIREAKGIADRLDSLLEIRLAFPAKGFPTREVLVAYIPTGNEKSWKFVEAFDVQGNAHKLDVFQAPEKPIIVVGLNAKKDMNAGLALMNDELRKAGMQPVMESPRAGLDVAKLDYIRLEDDQEPWISGDAEIYTLVNGIAPESAKSSIIAMEMPYLANDKTDYHPNQVLIVWQNYRYKAANLNVYEHDDNTNYKEIVASLIQAIGQVVPEYQMIADIASKIIRLMPDSWFTNDDDYVDVYYTLENKAYTNYQGASRNAKITLVPYNIPE